VPAILLIAIEDFARSFLVVSNFSVLNFGVGCLNLFCHVGLKHTSISSHLIHQYSVLYFSTQLWYEIRACYRQNSS
jgi:hypothetical protein